MIKTIVLSKIYPDPDQPRKIFKGSELFELKRSIEKKGILTPLLLESNFKGDNYLILDGERRYRASKQAKLKELPAKIIKGPLTIEDRMILRFHIQLQHATWSELDKARAIYNFKKVTSKTIVEIAEKLNLHIPKVHGYLSVLEFSDKAQTLITEHEIDFTYLIFLIRAVKHYLLLTDLNQEYIEEKLINKVLSGTFKTVNDIQLFSKVMGYDEQKDLKIKFLENLDYSFENFIDDTRINRKEELDTFYKNLTRMEIEVERSIERKYNLTKDHLSILENIRDRINEILKVK